MPRRRMLVAMVLLLTAACDQTQSSPTGGASGATTEPHMATTVAPHEERLVDVGGHRLHVFCRGVGRPTVLVELGFGGTVGAWRHLLTPLAGRYPACIYERDGLGESEKGPDPRDANHIVSDLAALVVAGDMAPVVLVSYSLGGLYAQLFAAKHPDKVAGLVFVDPRTAEFQRGYRSLLTPEQRRLDEQFIAEAITMPGGAEVEVIDQSAHQVEQAGPLPPVPVIVLSAGGAGGESEAETAFLRASHERLATQSPLGRHVLVEGARHDFRGHEGAILNAIAEVVRP
jgi:pimeloyl-ACP methyl ester carboxylesterase